MNINCIKQTLEAELTEERYIHTLGVMEMAGELAKMYGLDVEKAQLAGLLHDCAKCMPNEELRNYIKQNIKEVDENEMKNYKTLHAPVGAKMAIEKFNINDDEIISAIRWHTLGRVNMSRFEKIIFLSDKIEKRTRDLKYSKEILKILNENKGEIGLNLALLRCFKETIKSLTQRNLYICQTTIDVYNWLIDCT